jgi:hypothetical protein
LGVPLPIHVDNVPEYEVRGDCVRITWREVVLFVPIPICLAAMGRCQRALDEWSASNASIIKFEVDRERH